MKVLITGAAGGIGGWLIRRLVDGGGHEVVGFDMVRGEDRDGVEWVQGDILDVDALTRAARGTDAVVHLAGIPIYKPDANLDIGRVNVLGAQTVLEAAVRADVRRYVQASSICATGFIFWSQRECPPYFPVDEDVPMRPDDMYGLSKLVDEQLAAAYERRYGIETTSLRLATVWVPGSPVTEGELDTLLTEEMDTDLEFLDLRWQYVDVRDVAQAFARAVEHPSGLGVCNVGAADTPGGDWRIWVRDIYPDVAQVRMPRGQLTDPGLPLWSIARFTDATGYTPEHSWREYPAFLAAWPSYVERRAANSDARDTNATLEVPAP
jgi:nucleoside-diphosphate-sugar epimerase